MCVLSSPAGPSHTSQRGSVVLSYERGMRNGGFESKGFIVAVGSCWPAVEPTAETSRSLSSAACCARNSLNALKEAWAFERP